MATRTWEVGSFLKQSVFVVVALAMVLVVLDVVFPPVYRAEYRMPDTDYSLVMELEPSSLFHSNEYYRRAVLEKDGARVAALDLFPDTGGYNTASVHGIAGTVSIELRTYHCARYRVDAEQGRFIAEEWSAADSGPTLGSFEIVDRPGGYVQWVFIPANAALRGRRIQFPFCNVKVGSPAG